MILESNSNLFDGITVPAHVLALYRNSIGHALKRWNKPFFIDPMTHVFLLDRAIMYRNGTNRPKKSYEKLCEYAPSATYYLSNQDLDVSLMSHSEQIDFVETMSELATRVQLDGVRESGPSKRIQSLKRIQTHITGEAKTSDFPQPSFLVSPYFYFDSVGDMNYEIWRMTIKAFEKKVKSKNMPLPIYRAVCTSEKVLESPQMITALLRDLSGSDGSVIWINHLEKGDLRAEILEGFTNLVKGLSESGSKIISLYGGYLTGVFYHFGLDGLSYGLNAGDSKDVHAYATGGGAPVRYYDPHLHTFTTAKETLTYYGRSDESNVPFDCDCQICYPISNELKTIREPASRIQQLTRIFRPAQKGRIVADWNGMRHHFLHVRRKELYDIGNSTISDIARSAMITLTKLGNREDLRLETLKAIVTLAGIT